MNDKTKQIEVEPVENFQECDNNDDQKNTHKEVTPFSENLNENNPRLSDRKETPNKITPSPATKSLRFNFENIEPNTQKNDLNQKYVRK